MEGHPMLIGQPNQYCENDYSTESNLYVQCNPYQNSNDILHQDKKKSILKFIWKHKRTQITKAIQSQGTMLEVSQYLTSNYTTEP
jgi:hypothetical protein